MECSGFLLSLLSPVWRAMLCRPFSIRSRKTLQLDPCVAKAFPKLLQLGCGQPTPASSFDELVQIGKAADLYGLTSVARAVDWEAEKQLTVERAAAVLADSGAGGMDRMQDACRELARTRFDEFAHTAGFMRLDEDELGRLLSEDGLNTEGEERVLEAVSRWMRGGGSARGEGLLRMVRLGAIGTEYLTGAARELLPGVALLRELVEAALEGRAGGGAPSATMEHGALAARGRAPIGWGRYVDGGELRASGSSWMGWVSAVAVFQGKACFGTSYGQVFVGTKRLNALVDVIELCGVSYLRCFVTSSPWWSGWGFS